MLRPSIVAPSLFYFSQPFENRAIAKTLVASKTTTLKIVIRLDHAPCRAILQLDDDDETPAFYADLGGHDAILQILQLSGANVNDLSLSINTT